MVPTRGLRLGRDAVALAGLVLLVRGACRGCLVFAVGVPLLAVELGSFRRESRFNLPS